MGSSESRIARSFSLLILLATAPWGFSSDEVDLDRQSIIEEVTRALEERYVYPDVAEEMAAHLRGRLDHGDYDEVASLDDLSRLITTDLQNISNDGHIVVRKFDPQSSAVKLADKISDQDTATHARENFGFVKAERLAGNVGYLKFDYFDFLEIAGPTATAAMNFIANSDAVIIDLRANRGGKKDMVQFLASYFFAESTHFLTVYDRDNEVLEQTRSLAYVPGKAMPTTPVYILTSSRTASAAEAFSYNLSSFDRATIVGETTRGISHWVEPVDFPDHQLRIHVPYARPENTVTHTNWEGVGVKPDIEVPSDRALVVAHLEAITMLAAACRDEEISRILEWEITEVRAQAEPIEWNPATMTSYTGLFGDGKYSVIVKDGKLCWRYSTDEEYFLLPLNEDLFVFANDSDIRFRVFRDKDGHVNAFRLIYRDGYKGRVWQKTGNLP